MTSLTLAFSQRSAPGANRRHSHSGTALAKSQKKPDNAPTIAKPAK